MSIEGQGHFFTIYFPGFVCFMLYLDKISGERLQDHWSSGSNIFSETAWPIKAKFYVEPPWEGGTKVYIKGPGHMTKIPAMLIYGKNLKKSSSPELAGRFSRNLVYSIGDSCPS